MLTASRVLVAIAARSLADVGEEVTLTQYRSLVVLASRGPQGVARTGRRRVRDAADRIEDVRPTGQEGPRDPPDRSPRPAAGPHRSLTGGAPPRRRRDSQAAPGDRAPRRLHPEEFPCRRRGRAGPPERDSGRSARTGLEHGVGPMTAQPGDDALGGPPHPSSSVRARAGAAAVGRWLRSSSYLQRWIVLGIAIGAIAGLGAVVFYEALRLLHPLLLGGPRRLHRARRPPPKDIWRGRAHAARPWVLPLVAGGGALLGAVLVYRFAPEAEGHGTDAAISAVHHNPKGVRFRAVIVKIVASALTIGSGGSGGREGPTGQISAGFGSLLTRVLELEPADGRIAVATGIGSGIGAIFGAPLGGAVLASEILYRDDFDPAALLPCFIASSVSYVVFGSVEGFGPLFGYVGSYHFGRPGPARLVRAHRNPRRLDRAPLRQGVLRHRSGLGRGAPVSPSG